MNFKVGDVVETRDGREVEILKTDAPGDCPIIGIYCASGRPQRWCVGGRLNEYQPGEEDLLPPKRTREDCSELKAPHERTKNVREVTVWVNVIKDDKHSHCFSSEKEAIAAAESWKGFNTVNSMVRGPEFEAVAVPATVTVEW